jgi:hypothetical protein
MRILRRLNLARGGVAIALALLFSTDASAAHFNFDTGNAPMQVIIPELVPAIREWVQSGAMDASLVLRIVTLNNNSWFDAIAPYHPTAVGVYSRLGRRPPDESATNRNKNIAILYASYRVLNSVLPQNAKGWRKMLERVGLDPDNVSRDTTTPIGIGNVAGWSIVAAREHDGMNQLGDEGGRKYNRQPYADYTGYKPVNTAYELIDASRWQPNQGTRGNGIFNVQQFVTPQYARTKAYTFDDPTVFHVPPPVNSDPYNNPAAYKAQVDDVLAVSAALTDYQKGLNELFDDKLLSIGGSGIWIAKTRGFTLDEFVQMDFWGHVATFDAGIVTWQEKYRHDAVRPFSAIRYVYGDQPVRAWGGPGRGTVSDLPGNEWRSFTTTADHPEYPSGSACFCAAWSQFQRRFNGSDTLGFLFPYPKGSSRIEPGITPKRTIVLGPWETWTDFEQDCGLSRLYGGVHFRPSIDAAWDLCRPMGDRAYELMLKHLDGTAPAP